MFINDGVISNKLCISPQIVQKYNLNTNTSPDVFSDIFMPFLTNNPKGNNEMISFQLLKKWMNLEATLTDDVPVGA